MPQFDQTASWDTVSSVYAALESEHASLPPPTISETELFGVAADGTGVVTVRYDNGGVTFFAGSYNSATLEWTPNLDEQADPTTVQAIFAAQPAPTAPPPPPSQIPPPALPPGPGVQIPQDVRDQVLRIKGEIKVLEKQQEDLRKERAELEKQKDALKTERKKLGDELDEAKADLENAIRNGTPTDVIGARAVVRHIEKKIDKKSDEISKIGNRQQAIDDQIKGIQDQIRVKEAEAGRLVIPHIVMNNVEDETIIVAAADGDGDGYSDGLTVTCADGNTVAVSNVQVGWWGLANFTDELVAGETGDS